MSRYRWEGLLLLLILSACRGATQTGLTTPEPTDGSFNCSAVTEIPEGECQALVDFYEASGGSGWADGAGWLETATPCNWTGVSCAGNHVDILALTFNSLDGQLPETIGNLANLRVLDLHDNALRGPLPPELGHLSALEALDLSANRLNGTIPGSVGSLHSLQSLNLSGNTLTGTIPDELGQIGALRNLDLSHNRLSGPIPASLAKIGGLESVRLSDNRLEGTIPFDLGQLASLTEIDLSFNQLNGTVPSALFEVPVHRLWGNQTDGTIALDVGDEQTINFMGATFTMARALAGSVWAELVPEQPAVPGPGVMWAPSEHLVFTFVHENRPQNHSPLGLYLPAEAQLHVYPVAGLNVEVQPAVAALRQLLAEEPDAASYAGPLPEEGMAQPGLAMIPPTNAVQQFRAQTQYLSFAGGRGIRYLTQLGQGPVPASNQEIFYTFQGLTDDGATYVALYYPVSLPTLPDSPQVGEETLAEMMEDWHGYLAQTVELLNQEPATAFTPNLETVDALVSSLSVAGVTPLPAIQVRWPANGEAVDSQPVLQWEQFPGASTYHIVVVDDVAYPPQVVLDQRVGEPLLAVDAPLAPGHYSWTVWAEDSAGAILAELTAAFSVKETITLIAPAAGARVGPEPLLQWERFPGAVTYQIVVIDDAAYPPVVVFEATAAETEATVTPPLDPGNYSWRVLARDGQGQMVAELNAAFVVDAAP